MTQVNIRDYSPLDLKTTAEIFFRSIRDGAIAYYTEEQTRAWAPEIPGPDDWRARLQGMRTLVAEADGHVIGFMSFTREGHIEFAFVRPDWIGKGAAAELYRYVEQYALGRRLPKLTSDASLLARPFFERQGWHVVREQRPIRNGIALTNFRMEKKLSD